MQRNEERDFYFRRKRKRSEDKVTQRSEEKDFYFTHLAE